MEKSTRAFNYEEGQFICHIHAGLSEAAKQQLADLTQVVRTKQQQLTNHDNIWVPIFESDCDSSPELHMTLLRGHRAIYYHQIRPLVDRLREECASLCPFSVCLDELRVFQNHEATRQFLCIANRTKSPSTHSDSPLYNLKQNLDRIVKQFAIQLTSETETVDTVIHCSFMQREMKETTEVAYAESELQDIVNFCIDELDDLPICVVRIENIQVKIGNHTYDLQLKGTSHEL